jgi:hypothetical protein
MMTPILPLFVTVLGAPPVLAKPTPVTHQSCTPIIAPSDLLPFAANENLRYRISVRGLRAGRADLTIGDLGQTPHGVGYTIRGALKTNAFAALVADLDGQMMAILNPASLGSRFYRSVVQRGERTIRDRAVFSGRDLRFEHAEGGRSKKGAFRQTRGLDPLVALYVMRHMTMRPRAQFCHRVYAYRGLLTVRGLVTQREQIQTIAGSVQAWRVELKVRRGKRRYGLTLWVGDEASRPMWRAQLKQGDATVDFDLDRHELGTNPLFRL